MGVSEKFKLEGGSGKVLILFTSLLCYSIKL